MAFSRIQATNLGNSTTSIVLTFSVLPTVGNLVTVLLGGFVNTSGPAFAVVDNQGNTYTQAVVSPLLAGFRSSIWYGNILNSSGTFTITVTGASSTWGIAQEWSGFGDALPLAVTATGTGFGAAHSAGTTATTTEADAVVLAVDSIPNIGGLTVEVVSPTWTVEYNLGSFKGTADSRIISSIGTQTCNWTATSGPGYTACIAALVAGTVKSPIRVNQVVQSLIVAPEPSPIFANQIVQGLVVEGVAGIRTNQVVRTMVVIERPAVARSGLYTITGTGGNLGLPNNPIIRHDVNWIDVEVGTAEEVEIPNPYYDTFLTGDE